MTEPEFRSEPDFRSEPECDGYLQERTIDLWRIYGSCYNNHDTTMIHITGSNKNDENEAGETHHVRTISQASIQWNGFTKTKDLT